MKSRPVSWIYMVVLAVITPLFAFAAPASALEVQDVRWGFNGATKLNSFNLCSIDLFNPSSEPFQGPVQLKPNGGFIQGDDTPWVDLNLYVGPGETRTMQFAPFVTSNASEWDLVWGSSDQEHFVFPITNLKVARQVTVQFLAARGASAPITGVEVFREEDFPIGASGTEVLGAVLLDHVPLRWDVVRTRAFRDWLGRGGRLYLIQGRDGKPLDFPSSLAELNFPGDRFSVGQGIVTRHPIVKDAGEIAGLVTEVANSSGDPESPAFDYASYNDPAVQAANQIFQTMRTMIRPDHNWALIFLLAIIYLLILFPGIWLIGRKRGDYRVTYALILGTVVVFSWFYSEIGKRGYGESTGLREVMLAYPLGNQRVAVQKYCSLFVTQGGQYSISAEGEGAVLAMADGFSGRVIPGMINRPQAGFSPDIPPYSACSYRESTVLPTQGDYSIQIVSLEASPDLKKIEVALGAGIPATAQVYLVADDKAFILTRSGTRWVNSSAAVPLSSAFPYEYAYQWSNLGPELHEKNLVAGLAQLATRTSFLEQYNAYGAVQPVENSEPPPPKAFESGHLLVCCDAPAELLPSQYSATGKVMFVSHVDPSMVSTTVSP